MKNKNDFLNRNCTFSATLEDQLKSYNGLNYRINDYLTLKKDYEKLLEAPSSDDGELSFKDQWQIYSIVHSLSMNDRLCSNIDYHELGDKIKMVYPQVDAYDRINKELRNLRQSKWQMLSDDISFNCFGKDYFDERCINRHFFVRLDDELVCLSCGATTKDYDLSKEELDFLTLCAEHQGFLIKEATKEDLPLLQVLMERQDYYRSFSESTEEYERVYRDEPVELDEENELAKEAELPELRRQVAIAHLLDSQIYESDEINISNPKYLPMVEVKKLLAEVDAELKLLKNSDSRFKDLMIEECKTARYETLILHGVPIPKLLEDTEDEDEKIALVKAYYNISNQVFRKNSEYFRSDEWNALSYNCVTANPEINNRILKMKVRRN